ncbi:nascent polypeptide-associated complex subunit alpha, muscle-specific form [Lingula anatina]|uniref:Sex-determining region Y protein n=1 Tax=Lingula anatina TaxID=7574 RepID=A0A1S3JHF1_LINAN|nr:nascent polypeptide-associated complex subunit alpha, muscle-specific form [Lingula anatina]|eukprot:XP_013409840.1 nascent polypeptide-associated complex subunit alpha, muscle-specific form [Lingula anatina]
MPQEDRTSGAPPVGSTPSKPPEGSTPNMPPEGSTPSIPPEDSTPIKPPVGSTPKVQPEGNTPKVPPEGSTPNKQPEGSTPSIPPEGSTPSIPQEGESEGEQLQEQQQVHPKSHADGSLPDDMDNTVKNAEADANLVPPKRPKNGFIRFSIQYRREIARRHPKLDNREISRMLGSKWRKMTKEDKKPYEVAFLEELKETKQKYPSWSYGPPRQRADSVADPMPCRLRPKRTLKLPPLTRSYTRKKKITKPSDSPPSKSTWVQCDRCSKWRCLPVTVDLQKLPHIWFCEYNPDIKFNGCYVPEESLREGSSRPSPKKLHSQDSPENLLLHSPENGSKGVVVSENVLHSSLPVSVQNIQKVTSQENLHTEKFERNLQNGVAVENVWKGTTAINLQSDIASNVTKNGMHTKSPQNVNCTADAFTGILTGHDQVLSNHPFLSHSSVKEERVASRGGHFRRNNLPVHKNHGISLQPSPCNPTEPHTVNLLHVSRPTQELVHSGTSQRNLHNNRNLHNGSFIGNLHNGTSNGTLYNGASSETGLHKESSVEAIPDGSPLPNGQEQSQVHSACDASDSGAIGVEDGLSYCGEELYDWLWVVNTNHSDSEDFVDVDGIQPSVLEIELPFDAEMM